MENIILTGMPGCGKSTVGVILAKTLGMDFIDTDLIIQIQQKDKLQPLLDKYGPDRFRQFEEQALLSVTAKENTVIATGGSAVFCEQGMSHLKKNGICVYLEVPCDELVKRLKNIKTRGIAAAKGMTVEDIFRERSPYYEKHADLRISCLSGSIEENASAIIDAVTDGKGHECSTDTN
ncbi:MAG: shikimate kinase [Oscillospiraceae bacterium]|nr:shikimate kinase [Oscillospiraceae bacterium]